MRTYLRREQLTDDGRPEIGDDEGSENQWMDEDTDDSSEINVETRLPGSLDCVAVVLETPFPDPRMSAKRLVPGATCDGARGVGSRGATRPSYVEVARQDKPLRWRIYQDSERCGRGAPGSLHGDCRIS